MFPKNAWYVACTPDELAGKPLGRRICDEPMVFYRGEDGRVAALEDFCPHRGAPLSLGFVEDGVLVCGYHGLAMGEDGRTRAMPGQRVRGFPCIRRFPVQERHGFVWVWPGAEEQADAALIPRLEWAESPDWAYGGGLYHIHCDYRLMIDNLMDLTHETYVHASSIGQKEIDEAAPTTRVEGDEVITSRHMQNVMAPPFWRMALRGNGLADDVAVDRWQICRFTPPSHVLIEPAAPSTARPAETEHRRRRRAGPAHHRAPAGGRAPGRRPQPRPGLTGAFAMIEVIVGAIRLEAQDIHSFELFRADGAALPSFEPGAHIDLHLPNGLVRQYSLCGPAERPRHYRIAVLRCRDSRGGSATLHAELRVGQRLRIGEPRNLFPLSPEPGPRLLFAGGIGITPLLAMAERLARDGANFQLHYCAHSAERAAFVDYLDRCAFADRVHCHFDHGDSSRRADLRALLAASPRDAQLYLCGPAGFMQWIEESARELGWEASRLHREHFAAAPRDANADGTFEVQLASNGALIRVAAGQTVLAALREAGVDLPASCEQGICGTCLTRVLDGEPEHRDLYLSEEEQAANDCFTPCCSRSRSPRLVLDL